MGKTVLIINEYRQNLIPLELYFESMGLNVISADNVDRAAELIINRDGASPEVDIIVSDICIGERKLRDLLDEVSKERAGVPYIIVSDQPKREELNYYMRNNCSGYFIRPFNLEDLYIRVNSVLSREDLIHKKSAEV